jgi:hypothetical protein
MAGSARRFSLSAILLPLLFLTMSGLARAATITVTNLNDTGAGSLRAAITAHASGDTINFDLSGTITLASALPAIGDILTIDGSGQSVILSGQHASPSSYHHDRHRHAHPEISDLDRWLAVF